MKGLEKHIAAAQQIRRERVAAKPFISRLQTNIGSAWKGSIPREWQTAGFVLELTKAASDVLEGNPAASRELAQFAIVVARNIAATAYPRPIVAAITAEAWKELANAHRYTSHCAAALRALKVAEKSLADEPSADWERTLVLFAKALVLSDLHRFDEASALADETSETFRTYREHRRSAHALLLKGIIDHRRNRFEAAACAFTQAIDSFGKTDDLQGLAAAYNNFAYAQMECAQHASAATALQKALAIFDELNLTGEVARTRSVLGSLLLRTERYAQAETQFETARRSFATLGMVEEAGLAGLSRIDALLALGRDSEAHRVLDAVIGEFRGAALNKRALVALAYLQDEIGTPRAREAVALVDRFVKILRESPHATFLPLAER